MAEEESTFDPETFLNEEVEGEMETRYTPVPSDDYTSIIDDIDIREIEVEGRKARILEVMHKLLNVEELATEMGMEQLVVRQSIFLDIGPGGVVELGPNKNVKLGRLRAAVNQNDGTSWNFNMLRGAGPLRITVSQKARKGDPEIMDNRVDKTLPMEAVA